MSVSHLPILASCHLTQVFETKMKAFSEELKDIWASGVADCLSTNGQRQKLSLANTRLKTIIADTILVANASTNDKDTVLQNILCAKQYKKCPKSFVQPNGASPLRLSASPF